jgi:hypothetical protein
MIKDVFMRRFLHTYNAPRSTILPDMRPTDNIRNALTLPIQLYRHRVQIHRQPKNGLGLELTDAIADGVELVR